MQFRQSADNDYLMHVYAKTMDLVEKDLLLYQPEAGGSRDIGFQLAVARAE